jgi:hypothetical protein
MSDRLAHVDEPVQQRLSRAEYRAWTDAFTFADSCIR